MREEAHLHIPCHYEDGAVKGREAAWTCYVLCVQCQVCTCIDRQNVEAWNALWI